MLARKPLTGSVADNLERYGTGALNIDGCRLPGLDPIDYTVRRMNPGASVNATGEWKQDVEYTGRTTAGRFPSDLILTDPIFDGDTPGVVGGGETTSGARLNGGETRDDTTDWRFTGGSGLGDSGTYSRFFLIPKADRAEREPVLGGHGLVPKRWNDGRQQQDKDYPSLRGASDRANSHPTVKPLDLMRHLVRLVTPTGGTVLDPFLGSGTTALAAEMEGFAWIGIEKEPEYVAIAEARLNGTQRGLGLPA